MKNYNLMKYYLTLVSETELFKRTSLNYDGLHPESKIRLDKGVSCIGNKNYDRAIDYFNRAIQIHPKHILPYYFCALGYWVRSFQNKSSRNKNDTDIKKGIKHLSQALSIGEKDNI